MSSEPPALSRMRARPSRLPPLRAIAESETWGIDMDPLPYEPRSLRDLVEADLRRAARLVIKVQDQLDPQVRVATPEGDYAIAVTLPPDDYGRKSALRGLSTFMAWKQALAFTFASEIVEPDALYCVGISTTERLACLSRIARQPSPWTKDSFSPVEWLPAGTIDPVIATLLPLATRPLTPKEVSACNTWFGRDGKFPAMHLPSGEARQL